jgi:hypothetical protein
MGTRQISSSWGLNPGSEVNEGRLAAILGYKILEINRCALHDVPWAVPAGQAEMERLSGGELRLENTVGSI